MAADLAGAHAHPHPTEGEVRLPRLAWGTLLLVGATVAAAWGFTWAGAEDFDRLMMLPSGAPMFAVYHGLATREVGPSEARLRTLLFGGGYFVVWAGFTALSLLALGAFGVLGSAGGAFAYVPGALLVAAGAYQLTGWKAFCLRHCRSPLSFLMTHWRSGRAAALRMGLEHAAYCLGCCWLLMLVLFTTGAMSLLWMGAFALLILGEKVWDRGETFSRAMGVLGLAVGFVALGAAATAPPPSAEAEGSGMPGMGRP